MDRYNHNEKLKKAIMRRVYLAYIARKVFHAMTLKSAAIVLFAWGIFIQVSIGSVFANAKLASASAPFYNFFGSAFVHTEFIVQILVLGILLTTLWLGYDIYQTLQKGRGSMAFAR